MPLALILQKTIKILAKGAGKLSPWIDLVNLESLIIDRARSAFLVHWFGSGLPVQNAYLRINIENLEELRERYREVSSRVRERSTGPNLTEPLAGMAGSLMGIILSPAGAILGSYALIRFLWRSSGRVTAILGGLIMGPLATAIGLTAGALLLPVGFAAGIVTGVFSRAGAGMYDLLGSVARLMTSVTGFVNQLSGPRKNIRNPLVMQIMEMFDRVALLFAHILGLFSILVTRIGPLILPMARQGIALVNLVEAVSNLVRGIIEDFLEFFHELDAGSLNPMAGISFVLDLLKSILPMALRRINNLLTEIGELLRISVSNALPGLISWLATVAGLIGSAVFGHWATRGIQAAIRQIQIIRSVMPAPPTPSVSGGSGGGFSLGSIPFSPRPPSPHVRPDTARVMASAGAPPIPLSAGLFEFPGIQLRGAMGIGQDRFSVFSGERDRLGSELGQSPERAIGRIRTREVELRSYILRVVGRIMPPEIRVRMPELLPMFREIDHFVFGHGAGDGGPEFPVLDLPDNGYLRPVVRQMTVRTAGHDRESIQRFTDRMIRTMSSIRYPAPAG